jgi:hypothetical protein
VAVFRNRLFQAYLETQVSNLMVRFGRQILSWGQTDAFRLLDNINPIDNSFGGFLVPLDERRVPLDMLPRQLPHRQSARSTKRSSKPMRRSTRTSATSPASRSARRGPPEPRLP